MLRLQTSVCKSPPKSGHHNSKLNNINTDTTGTNYLACLCKTTTSVYGEYYSNSETLERETKQKIIFIFMHFNVFKTCSFLMGYSCH